MYIHIYIYIYNGSSAVRNRMCFQKASISSGSSFPSRSRSNLRNVFIAISSSCSRKEGFV